MKLTYNLQIFTETELEEDGSGLSGGGGATEMGVVSVEGVGLLRWELSRQRGRGY